MSAHHVVERIRLRQARGVNVELEGQFFSQPVVEQTRARIGVDLEQLGADDRDDAFLFDEVENVVPRIVVQARRLWIKWQNISQVGPRWIALCIVAGAFQNCRIPRFDGSGGGSIRFR